MKASLLSPMATPTELAERRSWVAAKFENLQTKPAAAPGIYVLANHDPVQIDSRSGQPLHVGGQNYTQGLYCHAVSKLRIVLPGPASRFTAVVGPDQNDSTAQGSGSVVFSVSANGQKLFDSGVMRYADKAKKVDVSLGGATEFTLEIGDAGDGIGWDQSDWAEPQVILTNGTTLSLSDLVLRSTNWEANYTSDPPYGFSLGGRPFSDLFKDWETNRQKRQIDSKRTEFTTTYSDPASRLAVTCVAVEYLDFPTVEWTVALKNEGRADTPVIADLLGIDTAFSRGGEREFVLHHQVGSLCLANDFQPLDTVLAGGTATKIATSGGRSSNAALPYFNLDWGTEGRLLAIGWPGQWSASFERDSGQRLRVKAGQETTHFVLRPGEEVRTPLIALQFTNGDQVHAQNVWRRWMVAHNMPRPGGKLPTAMHVACSSHQFGEMIRADEASQKQFIDNYLSQGMKLDYWWMDAGWYPNNGGWYNTGTWEVDKKRFPNGLRAVSDHGHTKSVDTIVWFEPERVNRGTWLYDTHPEWLLGPDGDSPDHCKLLDLGNKAAWSWLVNHIDGLLTSEGIDLYRQDFNIDPLSIWQGHDAPDRVGITENHYVTGYLAYWDELRRRHPRMLIDTCASGGRRMDLETLRRAVPLLRSDYIFEPTGQQCHTYGLSFWVPFQGTGERDIDPYLFRSVLGSSINTCYDVRRKDLPYGEARKLLAEWRGVAETFLGDFYPLTPYSLADDQWIAWQYNLPERGLACVQAFRRASSVYESARLKLSDLDPKARYEIVNMDEPKSRQATGVELMNAGLLVALPSRPSAAVFRIRRL